MAAITHTEVRMYRMGTGDCFALKFYSKTEVSFTMLIDAGSWSGTTEHIHPFIENLKEWLGNAVDVLVVTHEHKDHVYAFERCRDLFTTNFTVGEIWMAWTENDKIKKVKEWKEKYGQHKLALGQATKKLGEAVNSAEFQQQFAGSKHALQAIEARRTYAEVLKTFADLHLSTDEQGVYKGGLVGMDVVKTEIQKSTIRYFSPGDILSDIDGLPGVNIYVLGPPERYEDVAREAGGKGESYDHNEVLKKSGAFGAAITTNGSDDVARHSLLPFDEQFNETHTTIRDQYEKDAWRRIDYDWLYSAGSLALRMNSLTNNLSLALAIEFEESGRVMLFPGDAEFGSWASWHRINWGRKSRDGETPLVEDLLNRTVFYKVAHHLSHNGTASKLGLEMMKHKDLAAMATLDYSVISSGWKSTMPNRAIVKELLARTKGRLMIMNENGLFFDFHETVPIKQTIDEARSAMTAKERKEFDDNFVSDPLYLQYTVNASGR